MGKADLHLHTTASDGMMSPPMLLNYVSACTDLDLIAITDHDSMDGWEQAREFQLRPENEHLHQLQLVPGIEVSSCEGHVLGIGVQHPVAPGLDARETIAAIHEQGGLALAPHPLAWLPGLKNFAGIGRRFEHLQVDGVEVRNSTPSEFLNNARVARLNRRLPEPWAEYGGSDAHFLWAVGRAWTEYPGQGFDALRAALRARTTRARGMTWGPVSLWRYFVDRSRWRKICRENAVHMKDL